MKNESESPRLMSLDALRGFDMLFIMAFSQAVVAFCAWIGSPDSWFAQQMTHVSWHGLRHHDTIFPLFLFLAGVSWPFSLASQRAKGRSTGRIVLKIVRRMFLLTLLGVMTPVFFAFEFAKYRYDSVLAHIGVCWAGAAFLYLFVKSWKARLAVVGSLLVGHWLVLWLCRAPDMAALLASTDPFTVKKLAAYAATGTDGFSFVGNFAGWIDRTFLPGALYEGIFDPDGVLAKLTGVVTASLGVFAGELLRKEGLSGNRKTLLLAAAGAACLALTFAWQPWCPVNKKIWTSTFVLAVGAYSFGMLALFHWLVDVKGWRKWTFFFRVIGMNSITIYVLMWVVDFGRVSRYFLSGVAALGDAHWSALVFALGRVAAEWLVLLYLYRKKTFLRV